MKTSTSEVLCDLCHIPIKTFDDEGNQVNLDAIYVTLKGPTIGHKKLDFCCRTCLHLWGMEQ